MPDDPATVPSTRESGGIARYAHRPTMTSTTKSGNKIRGELRADASLIDDLGDMGGMHQQTFAKYHGLD